MAPHSTFDNSGYMPSNAYFGQDQFKDLLPISKELGSITLQSGIKPFQLYAREDDSQGLRLSALEIQEIEQAVNTFQRLHLPLHMVNPRTFPLPTLSSKLADVSHILAEQTGYFLISGLEPSRYTQWANALIHAGMSSYVGTKRAMPGGEGGDKNVLHHIKAMPPKLATNKTSDYHGPPNQNIAMPFHTDSGEIVSLFTLSPGIGGGRFYLASAAEIFDNLQQRRPDLAAVLFEDWTMISPSVHESSTRPIFFRMENGKLLVACSRARFTGTPTRPRPKSLPDLTAQQLITLDALHMIGMKVAISFDFQAGDLLFFNNTTMMHARDSFTDADIESEGPKRHLLRLILRDERPTAAGRWTIPRALEDVWKSLYDHQDQEEIFSVKEELFSWATSH